ncbi:MAG TPA: L,D-transpeptidase [Actinomycetota bacterium]|nr:L,D-transpeptidase [Actinomycetota bacterium]
MSGRARARRRRAGVALALCVAIAGLAGCTRAAAPTPLPAPAPEGFFVRPLSMPVPPAAPALIARLVAPTPALTAPGGSHMVEQLQTTIRPGGGPTDLLVLGRRQDAGTDWLHVRLPERPNGAAGWIDGNVAVLETTPWRIVVSTERRTVTVFWNAQQVRSFSAVVGAPWSPTPKGLFAIAERIPLANPDGFYGSWLLTLTAHSTVYQRFDGGDGLVAIHGRGGSSLLVPLRTAKSNGCVRLDDSAIDWLAKVAGPGTPVEIV